MKRNVFVALALGLGFFTSVNAQKVERESAAILHELKGVDSLRVKTRLVKAGDRLFVGDHIITNQHTVAVIKYDDGSHVFVSGNSNITIRSPKKFPGEVELQWGSMRAVVKKKVQKRGLKFSVRTRSAAMGVRGTDFIVTDTNDKTTLHTLEGEVLMAKDQEKLLKGEGESVKKGQTIKVAETQQVIPKPKKFEIAAFMRKYQKRHPAMVNEMKKVDPRLIDSLEDGYDQQFDKYVDEEKPKAKNAMGRKPESVKAEEGFQTLPEAASPKVIKKRPRKEAPPVRGY